jgi:hypothetical protein
LALGAVFCACCVCKVLPVFFRIVLSSFCGARCGAWAGASAACPPAFGLLLYLRGDSHPSPTDMLAVRSWKFFGQQQLTPRRMGWGVRSAQVKEEAEGRGTRSRTHTPTRPTTNVSPPETGSSTSRPKKRPVYPASKQCTAQHPTPAPPVVPRETLLPSTAARPSPRPGACPSSPSRCPAPPKPPPTRS